MFDWIQLTDEQIWWLVASSAAIFVVGIITLPWMLTRIPRDYFIENPVPLASWKETQPAARIIVLTIRNLIGAVFIMLGIVMLVVPGQGLLTILAGISLMTFPGKRALELKLIRVKHVLKTINWLRQRAGHEPLLLPEREKRGIRK